MTSKRDVVRLVLEGGQAPWVPWSLGFTLEAKEKLQLHYGQADLTDVLDNHLLDLGNPIGFFTNLGEDLVQDVFGVVWDRSVDKDIGLVRALYCLPQLSKAIVSLTPSTAASSWIFRARLPPTATGFGSSRSVSPSTSAPGRCGECRACSWIS